MPSRMALRRVVYFSRALTGCRFVSQKILRLPRNTRLAPNVASMARIEDKSCDLMQGYHFSKPLDTEKFEKFLKKIID
jgi:predicted signal transduction protein with EAL and GGDEF domain